MYTNSLALKNDKEMKYESCQTNTSVASGEDEE